MIAVVGTARCSRADRFMEALRTFLSDVGATTTSDERQEAVGWNPERLASQFGVRAGDRQHAAHGNAAGANTPLEQSALELLATHRAAVQGAGRGAAVDASVQVTFYQPGQPASVQAAFAIEGGGG